MLGLVLTFPRGKGCESAMTASPGFKGSCDYCNDPDHKNIQGTITFEGRGKKQLVQFA